MRAQRALFAIVAMSLSSGCYAYAPIGAAAPTVGTQLRISLSDQGTAELRSQLGPAAEQLEGRVQQSDDTSITLGVTVVAAVATRSGGGTVAVPPQVPPRTGH